MPIQVYGCRQCAHTFERLVPVGDQAPACCPVCGGLAARTPACVAYPEHKSAKRPEPLLARVALNLR